MNVLLLFLGKWQILAFFRNPASLLSVRFSALLPRFLFSFNIQQKISVLGCVTNILVHIAEVAMPALKTALGVSLPLVKTVSKGRLIQIEVNLMALPFRKPQVPTQLF